MAYDANGRNPTPTCCGAGEYCGPGGCVADEQCATITDIGLCVSQFNRSASPDGGTDVTSNSRCSWCCESQRCIPTERAGALCGSPIASPSQHCADRCNSYGSCDECTLSGVGSDLPHERCHWDSASQKCFSTGSGRYNPFAVVDTQAQCAAILYWGRGLSPSDGPMSIFEGSSKIIMIIFAVLFVTCLLAICVSGARVALLVNRTQQDWEAEHEEIQQSISAAVPRYGFAAASSDDEEEGNSGKKKKNKKKGKGRSSGKKNKPHMSATEGSPVAEPLLHGGGGGATSSCSSSEEEGDECHLCARLVEHDSRRRFVGDGAAGAGAGAAAAGGASSSVAETWHQIVLLPCYHRVCKRCVLSMAARNAAAAAAADASGRSIAGRLRSFFVSGLRQPTASTVGAPTSAAPRRQAAPEAAHASVGINSRGNSVESSEDGNTAAGPSSTPALDTSRAKGRNARGAGATDASLAVLGIDGGSGDDNAAEEAARISSVLDTPTVPEAALMTVLGGASVGHYVSASAAAALERQKRQQARERRAQRRAAAAAAIEEGRRRADAHDSDESSSSDSDSVDDGPAAAAAPQRPRGGLSLRSRREKCPAADCPVCSRKVELVFVPGKVIR